MMQKLVSACSSDKRVKELAIDRLSELPDCLLISILSLLSMREAVMTCVLSKRWLFLWTDIPELELKDCSFEKETRSKFVATVHKALSSWGANQRLKISFYYGKCFANDVNAWVQFVLRHKVVDVALRLKEIHNCVGYLGYVPYGRLGIGFGYMLPQMMYHNSSLISLSLRGCSMALQKPIQWGSLSKLCLKRVRLHEDVIENIFSGCPVLYDLSLKYCGGFNCLDVKSQSLRKLTIIGWLSYDNDFDDDDEYFLEISVPFIHYVRISMYVQGKLIFTNISSLVRANIDLEEFFGTNMLIDYTMYLFEKLHHVNELEVGPVFMLALSCLVEEFPQRGLESLKLNAEIVEERTHGILLKSYPHLRSLFISLGDAFSLVCLEKADFNCDLLRLRTIKISVYGRLNLVAEPMLTLVQLLLMRTPVLRRIVIDFIQSPSQDCSSKYCEILSGLGRCARVSPQAQILVAPLKFSS